MGTTIKVSNREIAIRAFDHLRHERKSDSALRLAHHLLHYDRISLGIGEVDWEIDMAIQKFGGNPRTGYRYTAHFSFKGETEMEKERYEEIFNGKEKPKGGHKVALRIYRHMYGKPNPAVHR